MSLFFIRFIARTKKTGVSIIIQARFRRMDSWMLPRAKDLVTITALVRGKNICAATCRISGIEVMGKNVPLSRNMGDMNRNPG